MKKLIYFSAIVLLVLSGCKPSTYKIEGTVQDESQNGEFAFIKERVNRVWTTIDSVQIADGKFTFAGACDSARVVYIFIENAQGEEIREPFVFENGNITLRIDTAGCKLAGTEQNEVLQKYMDAKKALFAQAELVFKSFNDSTATEAERQAFEQKMKGNEAKITDNDRQFSTEYVNTVVGNFVFGSSFYAMDIAQKEKIVGLMTDETKANERIAEIITGIEIEKKTAVGQKFTEIALPDLGGVELALSTLVGKTDYVLVDFWASWCGPCIQSLPELKALYAAYGGAKLEILGVSLDDDSTAWQATIKSKGINWKHISDLAGWKSAGAASYAIKSIPATVLIDKTGRIVGRNLSGSELEKILSTSNK